MTATKRARKGKVRKPNELTCPTCGDDREAGFDCVPCEITRLRAIERAARAWWKNRRPCAYTEADHLANPTINTVSDAEKRLAMAVAGRGTEGK